VQVLRLASMLRVDKTVLYFKICGLVHKTTLLIHKLAKVAILAKACKIQKMISPILGKVAGQVRSDRVRSG
jgi:hypothetical protein